MLISYHANIYGQVSQADTSKTPEKATAANDSILPLLNRDTPPRKWYMLQEYPIDSMISRQSNSRLSKSLFNLLLKDTLRENGKSRKPVMQSDLISYDGRIIRNITIKRVEIFAHTITDTTYLPYSWIERTGNALHVDTRRKVIEHNLLFKPNDQLDVFLISENERIMRDLPYIMDAHFIVKPVGSGHDSVDLILLTQDLWPIGFEAELTKPTSGNFGLWYLNVLGYGHQFSATTYWDVNNTPVMGYQFLYGTANISGTFIAGKMEYVHRSNTESYSLDLSRKFRTRSFRYAGGFRYEHTKSIRNIELIDSTLADIPMKYDITDIWAGKMFPFNKSYKTSMSSALYIAGRYYLCEFREGPDTWDGYLYPYQDKTQMLLSVGFSRQGFKKDNLIYTFGRTEDVPFGYMVEFISGEEWGQFKNRHYVAAGASYGRYFHGKSYFSGEARYGTFISGQNLEQSTLEVQLKYFSLLHNIKRFQYRNFATLYYLNGINRNTGEFTDLEIEPGITGLSSRDMRGNEKIVLKLESVLFSPYRLLGFRFAFFGSLDLGLIKTEKIKLYESDLFGGLGIGVRIRNDQLVFDTFEIKLSYYPGKPENAHATYFSAGNVPRLRLDNFYPDKPQVLTFK